MGKKKRKMGSSLNKSHKASKEHLKGGGGSSIFKGLPDIPWFEHEHDKRRKFDIIAFPVKSKNHPLVVSGDLKIDEDYDAIFNIDVHRRIGPADQDIVCLKQLGHNCPLCERAKEAYDTYGKDSDEYKSLKKSTRSYANVVEKGELKLFHNSAHFFTKDLIKDWDAEVDDEGLDTHFADDEDGRTIICTATVPKISKYAYEYGSFKFKKRDPIEEDIIESAISFDEYVQVLTEEEIEEILSGVSFDDEDDEEEKPKKKSSKPKRNKKIEDEDDDDYFDEDEDEEEEKPKKKKKSKKLECPEDYVIGEDYDDFEECEECDLRKECAKLRKELDDEE